jgi:hypothetical protein
MVNSRTSHASRIAIAGMLACAATGAATGCGSSQIRTTTMTTTTAATQLAGAARHQNGTGSSLGSFELPELGFASFRCTKNGDVQPFFDMHHTPSEDMVTIRAGSTVKRNFTVKTVGHSHGHALKEVHYAPGFQVALPFGSYHTATFTVQQGTEVRALDGRVVEKFASLRRCYVRRWSAQETIAPYG